MSGTACATGFTDNRQHDIFGGNASGCFTVDFNLHGFGAPLFQGLRRQNVFNFRGANAKCQCAERAVCSGVGIAADDGHTRQRHALFWPHHVNDTLIRMVQVVQLDAKFVTVLNQLLHLDARHLTRRVDVFGLGRDVVIHGGKGFSWLAHLTAMRAQTIKRLRRGHFMHQMPVDVQQWGFVLCLKDDVRIKQFFVQRFGHDYTPSAT